MMGSFTTILIHYFEHSQPQMGDYTTILGHTHLLFIRQQLLKLLCAIRDFRKQIEEEGSLGSLSSGYLCSLGSLVSKGLFVSLGL